MEAVAMTVSPTSFAEGILNNGAGTTADLVGFPSGTNDTANGTDLTTSDTFGIGGMKEWQIILIASMSAGGVVLLTILAVMWKLCKKNSNTPAVQTRNVAPAPTLNEEQISRGEKARCGLCPPFVRSRRCSTHDHTAPTTALAKEQSDNKEQSEVQQDQAAPFHTKTPLPPIGDAPTDFVVKNPLNRHSMPSDPLSLSRGTIPPRRLTPLNEHTKVTTTNLTGGTVIRRAQSYGPVHQHVELRGLPTDQRRPLPPTPD